jgi:hypothetical protein
MTGKPDQPPPEGATAWFYGKEIRDRAEKLLSKIKSAAARSEQSRKYGPAACREDQLRAIEAELAQSAPRPAAGGSPLRALIAKWRDPDATVGDTPLTTYADRTIASMCADELEQALAAPAPSEAKGFCTCLSISRDPLCVYHGNVPAKAVAQPPSEAQRWACLPCSQRAGVATSDPARHISHAVGESCPSAKAEASPAQAALIADLLDELAEDARYLVAHRIEPTADRAVERLNENVHALTDALRERRP